jgi:hypothetical protein
MREMRKWRRLDWISIDGTRLTRVFKTVLDCRWSSRECSCWMNVLKFILYPRVLSCDCLSHSQHSKLQFDSQAIWSSIFPGVFPKVEESFRIFPIVPHHHHQPYNPLHTSHRTSPHCKFALHLNRHPTSIQRRSPFTYPPQKPSAKCEKSSPGQHFRLTNFIIFSSFNKITRADYTIEFYSCQHWWLYKKSIHAHIRASLGIGDCEWFHVYSVCTYHTLTR